HGRPVPGHRPDRNTQPGQVRCQGTPDLAGPEHHMQPGLTHDAGPLADPQVTRRSATAQPRRLPLTLRWYQKTSNRFLEILIRLDRAGLEPPAGPRVQGPCGSGWRMPPASGSLARAVR